MKPKVTQESIENFNTVWEYCSCTKDEAKYEKQKIMSNFDEMNLSYGLMAEGIRGKV